MKAITLLSASALYMSTLSQAKQVQGQNILSPDEDKSIADILEKLEEYRSEVQAYETKV